MSTTSMLRNRKGNGNGAATEKKVLMDSKSFLDEEADISEADRLSFESFMSDLVNDDRGETLKFQDGREWTQRILQMRRRHHVQPSKAQMGRLYDEMLASAAIISSHAAFERFLRKKPSRSLSGILVIAVVMSPYPTYRDTKTGKLKQQRFSCAKNCYYCPSEPGMPRSYLSEEAAIARAARANFDAIQQFYSRANTLKKLGHTVDKIELSVLGGTFSQYPREYQVEFLRDLFWSANTFKDGIALFSGKRERRSLAEEIKIHETGNHRCRIVGLTLETRPDTIHDFEAVRRLREFGATRLQIGVQHTDDAVLTKINRGCVHADTVRCIRLLKNSGYKIDIHLMPNLPGSNPEKDKAMFEEVLSDDLMQADQWKVYPCQTVAYTLIEKWYAEGKYVPYSLEKMMEVVVTLKAAIPPWIRLNRIFRQLPAEHITSGITQSNFRQVLAQQMRSRGLRCNCIRCREVGTHVRKGTLVASAVDPAAVEMRVREYTSSGGREYFISMESSDETVLLGFVRLRLPACLLHNGKWHPSDFELDEARYGTRDEYASLSQVFPELYHAALIREAHVYGFKVDQAGAARTGAMAQSRGYGQLLMAKAEKIALREGYARVAVIAGVGTRNYYRLKMGYRIDGTYMVKDLKEGSVYGDGANHELDIDVFEERIATEVGSSGRGAVQLRQMETMQKIVGVVVALCLGTYLAAQLMPIMMALVLAVCYMAALNYALFWAVPFGVTGYTNKKLLLMSRLTMLLLDLAVLGKMGSAMMPRLPGSDECMCSSFWVLSLVSYVSAIYVVKLLYYKRASLMMQDPMVAGKGRGTDGSPPCSVAAVMSSLVVVFLACQYLVINLTDSECTGSKQLGAMCSDTFAPVNTWFAIGAIVLDLFVLVRFMRRWNAFLSMFAEEAAGHMMSQFMLVSLVMLSCVWNALCHLSLVYGADSPQHVDSFQGTPAFLLDCCLMATCVVLAFVDAQETMAANCQMSAIRDVHLSLKELSAQMRAQFFGAADTHRPHEAYQAEEEEP